MTPKEMLLALTEGKTLRYRPSGNLLRFTERSEEWSTAATQIPYGSAVYFRDSEFFEVYAEEAGMKPMTPKRVMQALLRRCERGDESRLLDMLPMRDGHFQRARDALKQGLDIPPGAPVSTHDPGTRELRIAVLRRGLNRWAWQTALDHMLTQTERCTVGGSCVYAGPNGTACAVGCLLSREVAEALPVSSWMSVTCPRARAELYGISDKLLYEIQAVHDETWERDPAEIRHLMEEIRP